MSVDVRGAEAVERELEAERVGGVEVRVEAQEAGGGGLGRDDLALLGVQGRGERDAGGLRVELAVEGRVQEVLLEAGKIEGAVALERAAVRSAEGVLDVV